MMRVCVEQVWPGHNHSCVFTGRDSDEKLHRFLFDNALQLPRSGEVWEVEGKPVHHEKYGPQIIVSKAIWAKPNGNLLIQFLCKHEAFRGMGIGTTRISALWMQYGDELFDILNKGDKSAIEKVEKFPADAIEPFLNAWKLVMTEGNIIRWLMAHEFPPTLARKVLEHYGVDALERLENNPYKLLAFTSWTTCDAAATRMGIKQDDPRRMVAAVLQCLYKNLDNGHTRMTRKSLEIECRQHFTETPSKLASAAVLEALKANAIHEDGEWISSLGVRMLELDAITHFEELLKVEDNNQIEMFSEAQFNDIQVAISEYERHAKHELNEAQRNAVKMAMTHRFSVLTGGAGVGKTTVLKALVGHFRKSLYLMALTGQAARRMTEATGHPASTIERFIRSLVDNIPETTIPYIVVDEASMLDLPLTTRLLRALPPQARLLLVGDPEQLPPVNFGLIFHKITLSQRVPKTELTIINRQKESSGIPLASRSIRDGAIPDFGLHQQKNMGVSMIHVPKNGILQKLIALKVDYPESQILAPKNSGGVGVADINQLFHNIHQVGKFSLAGWELAEGDPIIYKKNDPELDLVNGSLGYIRKIKQDENGSWMLETHFSGNDIEIPNEKISNVKLAYALTVHSAQGSQFDRVIIVVEKSQILDRTWVYTALTRGVQQVIFVGDQDALEKAITDKPKAHNRNVLFNM